MKVNLLLSLKSILPFIILLGFSLLCAHRYIKVKRLKWITFLFVSILLLILLLFIHNPWGTSELNYVCINTGTHKYRLIEMGIVWEKTWETPLSKFMIENIFTNGYTNAWQFDRGYTPCFRCMLGKYRHVDSLAHYENSKIFLEAIRDYYPEKLSYWRSRIFHPIGALFMQMILSKLDDNPEVILSKESFKWWIEDYEQKNIIEMMNEEINSYNKQDAGDG